MTSTTYTAEDAIQMLRSGGVDLTAEVSNPFAAYLDVCDEIRRDGGEPEFSADEFEAALKAATA